MASSSRDASGTAKLLKVESFDVLWHPTRTSGGVVPSIPFHPLDLSGLPFVHAGALEVESRSGYKPSLFFSFSLFVKKNSWPSVLLIPRRLKWNLNTEKLGCWPYLVEFEVSLFGLGSGASDLPTNFALTYKASPPWLFFISALTSMFLGSMKLTPEKSLYAAQENIFSLDLSDFVSLTVNTRYRRNVIALWMNGNFL